MVEAKPAVDATDAEGVPAYKAILQRILDSRPSGTRQRIAAALGKNHSFVSQITNPTYSTPIPARHINLIMEICHFSPADREAFLAAYGEAHPQRRSLISGRSRLRPHTVHLPDLGDEERNRKMDALVGDFVHKLAELMSQDRATARSAADKTKLREE